jgi:hypothetical protein
VYADEHESSILLSSKLICLKDICVIMIRSLMVEKKRVYERV